MATGGYYGRKKTFKEKLTDMRGNAARAFKKAAAITLIGTAAIGAPGYYHYGTAQDHEVKVRQVDRDFVEWDNKAGKPVYENQRIVTDKGIFRNEDTMLHMKFNADQLQGQFEVGKTYRLSTYGNLPFGLASNPNIVSAREVTPEELAEREKEKQAQLKQNQQAQPGAVQPGAAPKPGTPGASSPALSGATQKVIITAEGYDIQMTVPVEAVAHIRIDKVSETKPVHIVQPPRPSN